MDGDCMAEIWGEKRYNSLNFYLRQKFSEKVFKVSLDAGFTCPNRDGKISRGGCIFCSAQGSGDFTGESRDLVQQFHEGVAMMKKKWKCGKYIGYFQAYTNTYAPVNELREKYERILNIDGVVGIAIATRPDCLDDDVLDLLSELNQKTFLWVELGFQTSNDATAKIINRGYERKVYDEAVKNLKGRGIKVVTHVIFGLPGESREDMINTVKYVAGTGTWGIKFHLLYLMQGTKLVDFYNGGRLKFLEMDEYVNLIVRSIEMLPKDMVIHRLTGDSPRKLLIGPMWSLRKWEILNAIDDELAKQDVWQGNMYNE